MCSFAFLRMLHRLNEEEIQQANTFAHWRGPDFTGTFQFQDPNGFFCTCVHNLLDMSGKAIKQPLITGRPGQRLILLFNGEIYNHTNLHEGLADTECLLPLYQRMGSSICSKLDGEYAVVIYDEVKNQIEISVDPFLTKPLFLGTSSQPGEFGVATCASSLRSAGLTNIQMVAPNCNARISLESQDVKISFEHPSKDFGLEQRELDYDKWINSFIESVRKRAKHGSRPICVFLSSGYDSGAICLALNLLRIPYTTMSILGKESEFILRERIKLNRQQSHAVSHLFDGLSEQQSSEISRQIRASVEPFEYQHFDSPGITLPLWEDGGAIGSYFLAQQARQRGLQVNLSGAGADEIVSDYGFAGKPFYYHSQFGGLFPTKLEGFFPWKKFYGDTQRSYLFKDEYILGRFGVEGRYPFLDYEVVQNFLSLSAELKNARYKAPITAFLEKYGYPFEDSVKRGFNPTRSVSTWRKLLDRIRLGFTSTL
jgi:asparagine synthetase B (glutamine-hydrolysing)